MLARLIPKEFTRPVLLAGGVMLSCIAGYVNVAMLAFYHVPVSHMSGAASHVGEELAAGRWREGMFVGSILLAFLMGATACGVLIGNKNLKPGRRYGVAMMFEGAMLCCAALLMHHNLLAALPFASFACGLQNAMATSYHGMVLRTTHVTGIVTDLGLMLGHRLKGNQITPFNGLVLLSLLTGFITGGCAAATAYRWLGHDALWLPGGACLLAGAIYYQWRQRMRKRITR